MIRFEKPQKISDSQWDLYPELLSLQKIFLFCPHYELHHRACHYCHVKGVSWTASSKQEKNLLLRLLGRNFVPKKCWRWSVLTQRQQKPQKSNATCQGFLNRWGVLKLWFMHRTWSPWTPWNSMQNAAVPFSKLWPINFTKISKVFTVTPKWNSEISFVISHYSFCAISSGLKILQGWTESKKIIRTTMFIGNNNN